MEPNTMRWVDFWIGVPLCFLLTAIDRLQRFLGFGRPSSDPKPRRVLFIQLAEMGTMVVAYPALRKATELFPDCSLHFLCFKQVRSSVEMLGVIEGGNIITIDSGSLVSLVRDTLRFAWTARRRGIDTVITLETFVRYSTLLAYISGARTRVGFHRFYQEGLYTGDLLTHKVMYNAQVHTAHGFLDLVHALASPTDQVPRVKRPLQDDRLTIPKMLRDHATEERVWRMLRELSPDIGPAHKFIVLNPNASKRLPLRRLPLDSYARLARLLLEDPDVYLLVTGVADEKADAEFICAAVGSPRILDLTGRTTIIELLHVFFLAQVLVTNDSGPAHFACLTPIHVIVFFGPETPDRYRPLADSFDVVYTGYSCSPCVSPYNQRLSPCNDNLCLKSVDIDAVCDLVRARLRNARA